MTDVVVPTLNANDSVYTIVEWLFEDGQVVPPGESVIVVETSKAATEIVAEQGGILCQLAPLWTQCRPGEVVARLFATQTDRERVLRSTAQTSTPAEPRSADRVIITEKAAAFADEHGIGRDELGELGLRVVRQSDVEQLVANRLPEDGTPLAVHQRAIAAVVSRSHQTIPAAFAAVRMSARPALELARRLSAELGKPIGLPELLIRAVAARHADFGLFFAQLDTDRLRLARAPHIAITIDVGHGLFTPVLRHAADLSYSDVADRLMDFRIAAMRARFRDQDLVGANIMVSMHHEGNVVQAMPIVFPGHTCVVSLCSVHEQLRLDGGLVVSDQVVDVGVTYDHRVVNGADAVRFLTAIRNDLEHPDGE